LSEEVVRRLERIEATVATRALIPPLPKIVEGFKYHMLYGGSWWEKGPSLVRAGQRVRLAEISGYGRLEYLILLVRMPDETPPDVGFVVNIDGHEIEDWTIHEAHELGLDKHIAGYAGVLRYDTASRLYSYFSYWLMWPFTRSLRVEVANFTDVDAELVIWDVQFFAKPG
jgi:hypothetical protein